VRTAEAVLKGDAQRSEESVGLLANAAAVQIAVTLRSSEGRRGLCLCPPVLICLLSTAYSLLLFRPLRFCVSETELSAFREPQGPKHGPRAVSVQHNAVINLLFHHSNIPVFRLSSMSSALCSLASEALISEVYPPRVGSVALVSAVLCPLFTGL
jgi:hypothetical protein